MLAINTLLVKPGANSDAAPLEAGECQPGSRAALGSAATTYIPKASHKGFESLNSVLQQEEMQGLDCNRHAEGEAHSSRLERPRSRGTALMSIQNMYTYVPCVRHGCVCACH